MSGAADATRAGIEILEAGGNAMDAAVATAFALAVVEPTQSGLGGRTQIVYHTREGGTRGIDGATEVPASYVPGAVPPASFGWTTVGVPGTVSALARALEEAGSLPLATVLEPAIRYAREGFILGDDEAARLAGAASDLARDEGARLHFLRPDGTPWAAGQQVMQPVLAELLDRIAREGPDAFYLGDVARRMGQDIQAGGGFVAPGDLARYRSRDGVLVQGTYRGLDLHATYLPASGATTIQALQVLDHFDVAAMDPAERPSVVAQALLLAFRDRDELQTEDPETAAALHTSRERAALLATEVRRGGALDLPDPAAAAIDGEPPFTTHVSTADTSGMVVALTQSLGPSGGARVASPGLGFLYAVTMGGYLEEGGPGARPWSSQSPMVVLRDGRPELVLGGAGARRIISAAVQMISRWVDEGLPLDDAVHAPRFHPTPGALALEEVEGRPWPEGTEAELAAKGFEVSLRPEGSYFARLNVIELGRGGVTGVADRRWPGGLAARAGR